MYKRQECFRKTSKKNPVVSNFLTLYSAFECSVVNGLCDKRFDDGVTFISKTSKTPWVSSFLTLCSAFECSIVNGLCNKRFEDRVTFSSEKGANVADYFIVSSDLSVDTLLSSFEIALRVDSVL